MYLITFDMNVYGSPDNCEFRELTLQPSTKVGSNTDRISMWQDIKANTIYVDNSSLCASQSTGNVLDLGTDADSDITSNLSSGWFALGMMSENENIDSSYHLSRMVVNPTLTITYSVPIAPTVAPTGLSTVTGIPIELDWTGIPTSGDGGTSITGYNVYRSLNEFAYQELPNSSGSDSQLTFTDNEFLIHGFESEVILSLDKASETDDLDVTRTQAWYVGDITAKPDGTKLYTTNENWYVSEYTLSVAGDLTTATNTHNWSHSLTNPKGIEFNDDGTKVFFAVWNTGNVHEFPLGTAWDLSTIGSQTGTTSNGSIDGQSLRFSTDGMYLFFSDNSGNLLRHDLTSAFTPVNNQQQSVNPSDVNTIYGFDFSTDGKTLISAGSNGAELFEHSLGTAWDLSTLSFVGSKTVVPTNINGVALSNDDSRIWTAEQGTGQGSSGGIDTITQFDISSTSTLPDKSTNSITVGTVAGGVLLAEQTQLDNDDQLNSNTIEDWGIVVGFF